MKARSKWLRISAAALTALVFVGVGVVGSRSFRLWRLGRDFRAHVRYLAENSMTIGEAPARRTFSVEFLQAVFGDNPDLLENLRAVILKGLEDEPALNLGEVAAMLVTYHQMPEGKVRDVVVHAIGGFPLARRKPGFHANGYFFHQLDRNLWSAGNMLIGFLGRDIVMFAGNHEATSSQQVLLDSLFSGEIMPLVERLEDPLYFVAVFPDPKRVCPPQFKTTLQACIVKGFLSPLKGRTEVIMLTPSPEKADYAFSVVRDLKLAAELALKTRWKGVVQDTPWGPVINPWWSYEMVQTLEHSELKKTRNVITLQAEYERVMVNAVLKAIERLSRDLAQMRGSLEERLDPRVVDARLQTKKPLHYWSEDHQWGPDWPIPPSGKVRRSETDTAAPDEAGAETNAPASTASTGA